MKKFLSFAMALAMTASLVPATAFASSDAYVSNVVTVEEDTILTKGANGTQKEAPVLTLEAKSNFKKTEQNFRLKLENAEFTDKFNADCIKVASFSNATQDELDAIKKAQDDYDDAVDAFEAFLKVDATDAIATRIATLNIGAEDTDLLAADNKVTAESKAAAQAMVDAKVALDSAKAEVVGEAIVTVNKISDTQVSITIVTPAVLEKDDEVDITLETKATGGVATVSVVPLESEFSAETKTFAKTSDGATTAYVESVKNFQDGGKIDDFYIEEVVAGTIKAGTIKLKLSSGFEFVGTPKASVVEGTAVLGAAEISDGDTIKFSVTPKDASKALLIKVEDIQIGEDGADFGKVAKISVSGAETSNQTVEVGTYADFGMTLKAAAKELPVIYAGTQAGDGDNDENKTLKVTLEETVAGSWIEGRKLTLKLPEGVEFVDVDKVTASKFKKNNEAQDAVKAAIKEDEDNEISLSGDVFKANSATDKRKLEIEFNISAEADFTGDVDLVVTGAAVGNEELKATIATVKAPIEVKTEVNEVIIDYKNTPIKDITLIEPAAGLWEKGDVIILDAEEMKFEGDIKAEVVKGDMKLEKLDGDNVEVAKKEGTIAIKVKSQSSGTPAEIKISGIELYLERNLPAGDYELSVKGLTDNGESKNKFFMNNYAKDGDDKKGLFETESVTVMKDFVKVVTAGRDQNDTFTTKITVPVGADKIMAGTKEIPVDAPAYINKDGYTMLPVRAITEALNGVAIVRWDDATKTATISFGSRVFSMTVGSKTMNMNGVPTSLLAAPEIKNSRIFLPLRDLGYALGLTDGKIAWDAATSTATLN